MQRYFIRYSSLQGGIVLPSSKSQTLRAILFGTLGEGTSTIRKYLISPDTNRIIDACRLLGAKITVTENVIRIDGTGGKIVPIGNSIDVGNSGITLRTIAAVAALGSQEITITGDRSIFTQRNMEPLIDGLQQCGVTARSLHDNGYAPLTVKGPITPGKIHLSGEDSQHVTAALIAAAFSSGPMEITVDSPGEKPWVALTLSWFDRLRIPYTNGNFEHYRLTGNACYAVFDYTVPGDLSSAAFPIVAALITNGEISVDNCDMYDLQGDKGIISILQRMGASIDIDRENNTIHVRKSNTLHGIDIDINDTIDALPILAVVGCYAQGTTSIRNGAIARTKECDRIHAIAQELRKMGAKIEEHDDGLTIHNSPLSSATVCSHQDHRIALSLAVAGMGSPGKTVVEDTNCILKSYHSFVEDFKNINAHILEEA